MKNVKHHRKSIRLQGYDYSQAGAYFVTICTHNRECVFGDIADREMILNKYGEIIQKIWDEIPEKYFGVGIDYFQMMPNHIHGIIIIVGAQFIAPNNGNTRQYQGVINHAPTVGDIVRGVKARCSCMVNKMHGTPSASFWQRNYYEHVIRDKNDLNRVREYIQNNPLQWERDENNPNKMAVKDGAK